MCSLCVCLGEAKIPGSFCSARALWFTGGYQLQDRSLARCEKSLVRDKESGEHQEDLEESLPGFSECSQESIIEAESQRQVKVHQAEGAWVQLRSMREAWQ